MTTVLWDKNSVLLVASKETGTKVVDLMYSEMLLTLTCIIKKLPAWNSSHFQQHSLTHIIACTIRILM